MQPVYTHVCIATNQSNVTIATKGALDSLMYMYIMYMFNTKQ